MSQVITKRSRVSRRAFLKGVTLAGTRHPGGAAAAGEHVQLARHGVRRRTTRPKAPRRPIESRFVFWFNGNGIPERYWIPERDRRRFRLTPCLRRWRRSATIFTSSPASITRRPPYRAPATATTNR